MSYETQKNKKRSNFNPTSNYMGDKMGSKIIKFEEQLINRRSPSYVLHWNETVLVLGLAQRQFTSVVSLDHHPRTLLSRETRQLQSQALQVVRGHQHKSVQTTLGNQMGLKVNTSTDVSVPLLRFSSLICLAPQCVSVIGSRHAKRSMEECRILGQLSLSFSIAPRIAQSRSIWAQFNVPVHLQVGETAPKRMQTLPSP